MYSLSLLTVRNMKEDRNGGRIEREIELEMERLWERNDGDTGMNTNTWVKT